MVTVRRYNANTVFRKHILFVIQNQRGITLNDKKNFIVFMTVIIENAAGFAPFILEADMKMVTCHFDYHFRRSFNLCCIQYIPILQKMQ